MDIEKLTEAAERGDLEAIVRLAEHYLHLDKEEAFRWAFTAGKRQHAYGAYLAAVCKKAQARAACAFEGSRALDELREFHTWSRQAYALYLGGAAGSERVSEQQLAALCEEAAFERAFRLYNYGAIREAIQILQSENEYNSCLLLGLCLIEYYKEEKSSVEEDLFCACEWLSKIAHVQAEGTAGDFNREQVYTRCALHFSEIQRKGIWPYGTKPSPRAAVATLRTVRNVVQNKIFRTVLNRELSRYEKILFGKYVYIG